MKLGCEKKRLTGIVTQIGIIKNKPATHPMGTESAIALGTWIAGSSTSSAILLIIPMALKV